MNEQMIDSFYLTFIHEQIVNDHYEFSNINFRLRNNNEKK